MSRATTPIAITAASTMRDRTNPSARVSLTRLTIGNTATAVPMHAKALVKSSRQASSTCGSRPALTM